MWKQISASLPLKMLTSVGFSIKDVIVRLKIYFLNCGSVLLDAKH